MEIKRPKSSVFIVGSQYIVYKSYEDIKNKLVWSLGPNTRDDG